MLREAGRRAARLAPLRRALGALLARPGLYAARPGITPNYTDPRGVSLPLLRDRRLNGDLPYDRFLHEQLAGDILAAEGPPDDSARRWIATGFVARRSGSARSSWRPPPDHRGQLEYDGPVVLGLSLRAPAATTTSMTRSPRATTMPLGFFAGTKYPFAGSEEERRPSGLAPLVPTGRGWRTSRRSTPRRSRGCGRAWWRLKSAARPRSGCGIRPEGRRGRIRRGVRRDGRAVRGGPGREVRAREGHAGARRPGPAAPRGDQAARAGRPMAGAPRVLPRPRRRADRCEAARSAAIRATRVVVPRGVPRVIEPDGTSTCPPPQRPLGWPAGSPGPAAAPAARVMINGSGSITFRQGDRADPLRLRPRGTQPTIPSCSNGWPPTSSPSAGRSRRCTGGSCSRRRTTRLRA